jgi:hypothetical protein
VGRVGDGKVYRFKWIGRLEEKIAVAKGVPFCILG